MKRKEFLVPIVTPFRQDGSVNYEELRHLVKRVLNDGADGIYAGGASSEFTLLTDEERKLILEEVIKAADGAYVAAHIGHASERGAISLAKHAEKAGADCLASVPPYWYAYTFEEIKGYYDALASATLMPVMIYNIPQASKIRFSKEEFYAMLSNKKIFAVKYTDTDYFVMERIKTETDVYIYSGSDECFLSALAAGADGAIGTTFNIMMDKYIKIRNAYNNNDHKTALKIMTSANNITEAVTKRFCLLGVKYILTLQGIDTGECRKPFGRLTEDEKRIIKNVFEKNI